MNPPHPLFLSLLAWLGLIATISAGPRSAASYTVPTDTVDAGGQRITSASYTHDGSLGGITGISTVTSPAETAKHGYIGQLTEVTALQLAASPATVDEGGTRQLSAWEALDDDSFNALPPTSITWSVMAGPFNGIDANGLATAAIVYEDTLATAKGDYGARTATLGITVLNVNTDDIPGYSDDGLDDAWQVEHFGLSNPNAAPGIDADFDGQDNRFEFIAGLIPTDAASRFLLDPTPVPNQPGQMNLVISPRLPDRTYTVKTSPTLGPAAMWEDLTTFTVSDDGSTRTITDTDASGDAKFYHVEITKP